MLTFDSFCNLIFSLCASNLLVFFRFFAEWNYEREEALGVLDSYLKNVVKRCSLLHWLKASMQPLYFKGASWVSRMT